MSDRQSRSLSEGAPFFLFTGVPGSDCTVSGGSEDGDDGVHRFPFLLVRAFTAPHTSPEPGVISDDVVEMLVIGSGRISMAFFLLFFTFFTRGVVDVSAFAVVGGVVVGEGGVVFEHADEMIVSRSKNASSVDVAILLVLRTFTKENFGDGGSDNGVVGVGDVEETLGEGGALIMNFGASGGMNAISTPISGMILDALNLTGNITKIYSTETFELAHFYAKTCR